MGGKGIRFDEWNARIAEYWQPTDFDPVAVLARAQRSQAAMGEDGWLELQFDDPTFVLTGVVHRLSSGERVLFRTTQTPQDVLVANGQAPAPAATGIPDTFEEMWATYQGWDVYQEYAASRLMEENTNFLNAVAAYHSAPSVQAMNAIKAQYIGSASATQININGEIEAAIDERDDGGADVFDAAETEVIGPLRGDWQNFKRWYAQNHG